MSLNVTSLFRFAFLLATALIVLPLSPLVAQYSEGFDTGERGIYQNQCWFFASTTVYDAPGSSLLINGPSVRTGQLTNMVNPHTLATPCTWFYGSGDTLRFSHYVHTLGGSSLKRLDVVLVDEDRRVQDTLLTHIYTNTQRLQTKIPVRAAGAYRIEWRWIGQGGTGRALIDDITVPGLYAADPDAGCSCTGNSFPVEWGAIRVVTEAGQPRLEWETLSELNASHFVIQRSADGHLFEAAGQVAAQGFSDAPVAYTFHDRSAPRQARYYRLQQVDLDGSFSYSTTLRWTPTTTLPELTMHVPAPGSLHTHWSLPESGPGLLLVRDAQGRMLHQQSLPETQGTQTLSTHTWSPGLYVVQLIQGEQSVSQKWVIR